MKLKGPFLQSFHCSEYMLPRGVMKLPVVFLLLPCTARGQVTGHGVMKLPVVFLLVPCAVHAQRGVNQSWCHVISLQNFFLTFKTLTFRNSFQENQM